ncbi:arsenate reductase [Halomonas binhaiensis]|uniref:Arsenate reductase n=1 Tax=Halomonas binhaiensis TaxID=2562282 RepID=A0A5C1ND85_9GAMM|nr:arsenate reductase [Halomonas binhaiensis]QEM80623.1 arsenate reductase [Halomonas binhaiensis]
MLTLYGIKNCDTCRKASKALENKGHAFQFHDLRQDGLSAELLDRWLAELGLATTLNKRSTTWRNLSDEDKAAVEGGDITQAKVLLLANPTLIKRPLLDLGERILVGFKQADYDAL